MVEVVQDFLHYVQSGFDLNRQDILTFHADLDEAECCLLSEDASDPVGGRQVVRMKDLLFNEVLDVPFEDKGYYLQLEEFSLRCQRVVPQIDMQLVEAQRMILHQPHCQSKRFVELLKVVTDELHRALCLMQQELETVWHLSFEPFFYPDEPLPGGKPSGKSLESSGFLDLSDMFLAAKLLVRHVADVVALIASASHCLPERVLDRERLLRGDIDPEMRTFLKDFFANAPRLRASLPSTARRTGNDKVHPSVKRTMTEKMRLSFVEGTPGPGTASLELPKKLDSAGHFQSHAQARTSNVLGIDVLDDEAGTTGLAPSKVAPPMSRLNEAMGALDAVVVFHLTELTSDMHRQMYWAFVRMCQFYVRWKRAFETERARCRQKMNKRHSRGRESLGGNTPLAGARGTKSISPGKHGLSRRFSQQQLRSERIGSIAGSSSQAPSESDKKSAMRSQKPKLKKSQTSSFAAPQIGHVGFADTEEVRTFQSRDSQAEGMDSDQLLRRSITAPADLDDDPEELSTSQRVGRMMRLSAVNSEEPLNLVAEDDELDGLD